MAIADDSGIFRLASVGSYLDALSSITAAMGLKERSDLIYLDKSLHRLWGLGQNVILCWSLEENGVSVVVMPHYSLAAVAGGATTGDSELDHPARPSASLLTALPSSKRHV